MALDAANLADRERDVLGGNIGAGQAEHGLETRARVRRAADDLQRRAGAVVDGADAQPVGVRMLLGGDDLRDLEGLEFLGLVLDALDLEPDHGQLFDDLVERGDRVEMLFQPGESEFHFPATSKMTVKTSPTEIKNVSLAVRSTNASLAATFWTSS